MESGDYILEYRTGIRCIELNLKELESAVKSCADGTKCGGYPSWKYPHMELECLDIEESITNLKERNMTPEVRYIHLAELCIDRLYYSHICSIEHMRNLYCKTCTKKGQAQLKNHNDLIVSKEFIPLENQSSLDCATRTIGLEQLIQNLIGYLSLLKSEVSYLNYERFSQTEEIMIECCKSCFAVQSVLKTIGETLGHCLHALSIDQACISRTKIEIRDEMYWCTQWAAIKRWCRALEIDCHTIVEKVTENVQRHEVLEKEVGNIQRMLNVKNRDHSMITDQLGKTYNQLRASIESVKKEQIKLQRRPAELREEQSKLKCIMTERKEVQKKETHRMSVLKSQVQDLERLCHDSNDNIRIKEEKLKTELNETEHLQGVLQTLQDEWAVQKDAMCEQMNTSENEVRTILANNSNLKYTLNRRKKRLRILQKEDHDNANQEKDKEDPELNIIKLEVELRKTQCCLESCVLYSENDWQEPVHNSFVRDDILAEMERQQLANETRIQILQEQNEKFNIILQKLNPVRCQ